MSKIYCVCENIVELVASVRQLITPNAMFEITKFFGLALHGSTKGYAARNVLEWSTMGYLMLCLQTIVSMWIFGHGASVASLLI
jgi:hypothetical protein